MLDRHWLPHADGVRRGWVHSMEDTVEHAKWFDALPIDDADKRLIAYENAMRLFKIDFPKIKKKGFIEYTSTRHRVPAHTRDSQDRLHPA